MPAMVFSFFGLHPDLLPSGLYVRGSISAWPFLFWLREPPEVLEQVPMAQEMQTGLVCGLSLLSLVKLLEQL